MAEQFPRVGRVATWDLFVGQAYFSAKELMCLNIGSSNSQVQWYQDTAK